MIAPVPVLVVDDSLTIRNIVIKNLTALSFNDVDVAEDGQVALERLGEKQYGLVISDWEMPNMGGEQLLKMLRQDPRWHKVPVIMITGTGTRGASWLAGANAYLQKPFTESDFEKAVRTVFGRS
jgi:two-component system chemotaxis response regulator CheY